MNRKFTDFPARDSDDKIVKVLKDLIAESDLLLNLHDGSGFYSETWKSDLRNPKRYGQSIIADCDTYYSERKKKTFYLGEMAREVCAMVNPQIENKDYHFRFNNHRTSDPDTMHAEQRRSATYFALTAHDVPAFGIETSKHIPSYKLRVKFQTMLINAFMKHFDIIPDQPKIFLDAPKLEYLIISINNSKPMVVYDKEDIMVRKGDTINISHIEANYERGLSADILGVGTPNDFHRDTKIDSETKVVIRKDKFQCGSISVKIGTQRQTPVYAMTQDSGGLNTLTHLIVEVNGIPQAVNNGGHLKVLRGDFLKITDAITYPPNQKRVKVNFKGFVPGRFANVGEDRGYLIDTTKDLMKKYSAGGMNVQYPIMITSDDETIGIVWVEFTEPRVDYLVVKINGGSKRCYLPSEVIEAHSNDRIEVIDAKTNVNGNERIQVDLNGPSQGSIKNVVGKALTLDKSLLKGSTQGKKSYECALVVKRGPLSIDRFKVLVDSE
jgi:hypothetical protein